MHPNFRFKFWERDVFIAGDIARNQERQTFFRFGLRDLMLLSTVVAETDERSMNRIKSTIGPTFDVFYFPHKEFLNFFFLYWKFVPFSGKGRFSFEQKEFQKESSGLIKLSVIFRFFDFFPFYERISYLVELLKTLLPRWFQQLEYTISLTTMESTILNLDETSDCICRSDLDRRIRLKWRSGI